MKPLILNRLRKHGPLTATQLHEALRDHYPDEESLLRDLRALRSEGRVLRSNADIPKWKWSEDFVCALCHRGFPEVKRYTNCTICRECRAKTRTKRTGVNDYTKTRLSGDDCGPYWAGRLSADFLRRSIRG